jgi:uncharacterized membrane protein
MNSETLRALLLVFLGILFLLLPDILFSWPLSVGIPLAIVGIFLAAEGFSLLREILMPQDRGSGAKKHQNSSFLVTIRLP